MKTFIEPIIFQSPTPIGIKGIKTVPVFEDAIPGLMGPAVPTEQPPVVPLTQIARNFERIRRILETVTPTVRAFNSAAISIPDITVTKLTFNSHRYDTANLHSLTTNNGRLTASVAGVYSITGQATFGAAAGTTRAILIYHNGTTIIANAQLLIVGTAFSITTDYYLAVGDYVELALYQDSGGAVNATVNANFSPEFMMHKV